MRTDLDDQTQVKTLLGLFYIHVLAIDPSHINITHYTFNVR